MRRPAFTLIETLIALAIVIVVLGASITANRVIQIGSLIASEHTQMAALADESISDLQLIHKQLQATNTSLGDNTLGFVLPSNTTDTSPAQKVAIYADKTTTYLDATTLHLCTALSGVCKDEVSPLASQGTALSLNQQFTRSDMGGELVGVRHTTSTGRQLLSMSSRLSSDGGSGVADTSDTANWDFYVRKVLVTRLGTTGTWYGQTISQTQGQARSAVYQVTIRIEKYKVPSIPPLSRTIFLTDN